MKLGSQKEPFIWIAPLSSMTSQKQSLLLARTTRKQYSIWKTKKKFSFNLYNKSKSN